MEDETAINPGYLKGFNEGYVITKHLPELADKISKVMSVAPRIEGFLDGRKQFVLEQVKGMRPEWMKRDLNNGDKKQDPTKGRDLEPDL